MNKQHQPGTFPARRPLKHWQVAIRIPKRGERSPADMVLNANRFALPVVQKIELWQFHQNGLPISQLEFQLSTAANHLFRRHSVDLLRPRSHELNAAT